MFLSAAVLYLSVMISKTVKTMPLHIVMSLSSSLSMLNFYFCKVSLFFLVILPSFNCVPSLHHSSNLLSKNLPVFLLDNIKKYLDLSYIFFLPQNFSYKMYIQKSMCNLKNNKISDHVLISKIKNCLFFCWVQLTLIIYRFSQPKIKRIQGKKFEKVPKSKTWIGLKLATISIVFTLYL